ncbi:MAG: energy transducer TonB [Marinilabiliales bacterium]|mgnify:CR=1 FL=1|nr:MAG: energy transducer TonB [Marinilabiliales bacterium]
MKSKKTKKADLENKRGIFFQIGLIAVLGIVLLAFEWTNTEERVASLGELGDMEIEEEIIPITRQEEIKPPPPPPPQAVEVINIVEDDTEIEEELEIEDTEIEEDTEVEIVEIEEEEEVDEILPFAIIEDKPGFPGGDAELFKYLQSSIQYPVIARENNIEGRVFVSFVIGKDGSVTDVKILRGVDPYLDKEAERVVKAMPKWKPGKQRGKPVKVQYQIPINFRLN